MPLFRRHHRTHDGATRGADRGEGSPVVSSGAVGGPPETAVRLEARVSGVVQGVGFRYWTLGEAERRGLVGSAGNLPDGTVEVIAEGDREDVESLLTWLRSGQTPGRVDRVEAGIGPATGEFSEFSLF